MLPAGQDAAEAFYRITDAAYERRSVAVTSNIHPAHPPGSRKTAGQRYRTSSPVTARPMIIRWISDVPSKMVKIFASRCQRSTGKSRV